MPQNEPGEDSHWQVQGEGPRAAVGSGSEGPYGRRRGENVPHLRRRTAPEAASAPGLQRDPPGRVAARGPALKRQPKPRWLGSTLATLPKPSRCPTPEPRDLEPATPRDRADWPATCCKDQAGMGTEEGENQGGRRWLHRRKSARPRLTPCPQVPFPSPESPSSGVPSLPGVCDVCSALTGERGGNWDEGEVAAGRAGAHPPSGAHPAGSGAHIPREPASLLAALGRLPSGPTRDPARSLRNAQAFAVDGDRYPRGHRDH